MTIPLEIVRIRTACAPGICDCAFDDAGFRFGVPETLPVAFVHADTELQGAQVLLAHERKHMRVVRCRHHEITVAKADIS